MKILLLHNSYKQPGGEDVVVRRESAILRAGGHQVLTYFRHNEEIDHTSVVRKIATGTKAIWAVDSYRELAALLRREKPNLAHFHNTFPLISPSAYYACHRAQVPVVQTLHNYRLFCPAGTFFRNGSICEECSEHGLWRSVQHGCYRDSRTGTAGVALMLTAHRAFGTWARSVSCFIAVSEFVRGKVVAGGFPPDRVFVKPNFVDPDPAERTASGGYAVFVGRLSAEKGLRTLIAAWANLENCIPLIIVGDGPLRAELEREAKRRGLCNVRFDGYLPGKKTLEVMKGARFLIFPSEWYETFGMTIVEAFACGVPVICSRLGAMQELVADSRTGLHFSPGDSVDLAAKLDWAWTHTQEVEAMGRAARVEYEAKYTAAENYRMLMRAYGFALTGRQSFLQHTVSVASATSGTPALGTPPAAIENAAGASTSARP